MFIIIIFYIFIFIRPHGSLNYFTPDFVFNLFSNQDVDSKEIKSINFNDLLFVEKMSFPYFFSNFHVSKRYSLLTFKYPVFWFSKS
jgi:hypothetical protein